MGCRAAHADRLARSPSYRECTAAHVYANRRRCLLLDDRCDRSGAGTRTACQREPSSSLPRAQVNAVLADRRDVDVDPLGEGRIMLDAWALRINVDLGLVRHEED